MESATSTHQHATVKASAIRLTVPDKLCGRLVVLLLHQPQVQRRAISDLVIRVVQTPGQQHINASLDLRVLLSHAELCQRRHCGSPHDRVLQHNPVVDVTYVLGRLRCLRAFHAEEVEDTHGQLGELAVFDELAEMRQSLFLAVGHEFDQVENTLHNAALEVVSALISQNA